MTSPVFVGVDVASDPVRDPAVELGLAGDGSDTITVLVGRARGTGSGS